MVVSTHYKIKVVRGCQLSVGSIIPSKINKIMKPSETTSQSVTVCLSDLHCPRQPLETPQTPQKFRRLPLLPFRLRLPFRPRGLFRRFQTPSKHRSPCSTGRRSFLPVSTSDQRDVHSSHLGISFISFQVTRHILLWCHPRKQVSRTFGRGWGVLLLQKTSLHTECLLRPAHPPSSHHLRREQLYGAPRPARPRRSRTPRHPGLGDRASAGYETWKKGHEPWESKTITRMV